MKHLRMKFFRTLPNSTKGFTLLEVVVAMTIVGLGVVTLLEIFSLGLRLGTRSTVRTEIVTDGRQVMDQFLSRAVLPEGTERGSLNPQTHWQFQVQGTKNAPTELSLSNNWELKEVVLDITTTDNGRARRLELNTLRLVKKKNP
jgi:prepilin-type N-terminal cleavage/methylation domain-containing protein